MVALVAIAVSLVGLLRLMPTDAKRRRVFRLPPLTGERHGIAARILLIGPGLAFAGGGDGAGFTLWLGGLSCVGWACVAAPATLWARAFAMTAQWVNAPDAPR